MKRLFLFLLTAVGLYAQNQNVTVQPSPGSGGMNTGTFNTYGINYYLAKPATTWDFTQATVLLPQSISGVLSINAGPGIGVNNNTGQVTVSNLGVITLTAGSGLVGTSTAGNITLNNVGVLGLISGNNISITGNGSYPVINATSTTNGTVTSVSVTTQNGIGATVANSTTTPAITLNLGNITPNSVTTNGLTLRSDTGPMVAIAGIVGVTGQSGSGVPAYNYQPTITSPTLLGTTNAVNVTTNGLLTTTNIRTTGLTGYLYGNDITGNVSASTTIPTSILSGSISLTSQVSGILPIANGGTGTSSPSIVAGTGISVTGSFPNQTLTNTGVTNLVAGTGVTINSSSGSVTINATGTGGTVTSVGLAAPSGFTVSNSPVTSSGTLTLSTALNGYLSGNGANGITASTTIPTSALSGTIPASSVTGLATVATTGNYYDLINRPTLNAGTVTSVSGTGTVQGISLSGTVTTSGSLTLGGSLSPINLTSQVSGTLNVASGGTGTATPATVAGTGISVSGSFPNQTITNAGVTNLVAGSGVTLNTNNGSVTINATGTGGTVTSVSGTGTVQGITLTGNVTSSGSLTLGGSLSAINLASQVSGTLNVASGGTGASTASGARANILPSYTGQAGNLLAVNGTATDVVYVTPNTVSGSTGYWGSFYDTTNQTAGSTTSSYTLNIGSSVGSSGVSIVGGNKMTFAYTGTYNIQYSIQFINTDTGSGNDNVDVWIRLNGVDVPYSNSIFNIPNAKAGVNGALIAVTPYLLTLNAGDYVQIMWAVSNTGISVVTTGAQSSPTVPVTPGVIVAIEQVANIQTNGTVTSVSVTGSNGVGVVTTNSTTTPSISLNLGAITPTSVSTGALTATGTTTLATGLNGYLQASSGVVSASSTIPTSALSGTIALGTQVSGTLNAASGGTGVAGTITGYEYANGTGAHTASTTIPTSVLSGTISNSQLTNNSITIAGTATALGGSISQDTITGLSTTGLVQRTGANTLAIATPNTNYLPATTGNSAQLLASNGSGGMANVNVGSGLSYSGGTLSSTSGGGSVTNVTVSGNSGVLAGVTTPTTTPSISIGLGNITPLSVTTNAGSFTTLNSSGVVNVSNNTASTNTTTGSIVTAGGIGVAGSGFFGSDLNLPNDNESIKFVNSGANGQISTGGGILTISCITGTAGSSTIKIAPAGARYVEVDGAGLKLVPGSFSSSAWGTAGVLSQENGTTVTDSSTAASGTATSEVFHSFATPTLAATNTSVTTTDAANVYIAGGVTAGTNQTITNNYGLWNAGNTRIDGNLYFGSPISSGGYFNPTLTNHSLTWIGDGNATGNFIIVRPNANVNTGFTLLTYGTVSSFYGSGGVAKISNASYDAIQFSSIQTTLNPNGSNFTTPYLSSVNGSVLDSKTYTLTDSGTAASGTLVNQTNYYFAPITLAATNTGVTTTDAATVRIGGNPTAGTNETITNSWGLWNAGNTRLDGNVKINSSTASSSTTSGSIVTAGGVGIGGNAYVGGVVVMAHYTVATLPTASSYTYGECFVSDATQAAGTSIGSSPTGGGSVKRKVYSDGTNWLLE